MPTTKTELVNNINGDILVTKTSAPFDSFSWDSTGYSGNVDLVVKWYVDDILVETSPIVSGTEEITNSTTYNAVWKLDKVDNPSYSGASIKVKRIDNGSVLDIGFVGDELDTAAIQSFAPSGYVAYIDTIYDQSGNGNHLTADPSSPNMPYILDVNNNIVTKNGKPAIKFEGSGTRMLASNSLTAENGLTILAVFNNDTTSGSNKGFLGKWNGSVSEYALMQRHFSSPNDISFISKNSSNIQNNLQSGVVLSTKQTNLYTLLYDGTEKVININGLEEARVNANIGASDSQLRVGGYSGATDNADFFFLELRIAKSYDEDFATKESEMLTKYGI